jgi:hypothetical protein
MDTTAGRGQLRRFAQERDWDQLNLDVAFDQAGGKVIWQPRILAWYSDKQFAGEALPAPYAGMTLAQLYRALGCSNRVYEYNACFKGTEDPRVTLSRRELSATEYELCWTTPVGRQRAVYRMFKESPWHEPVKWPIADEQEMKVAAWRAERTTWAWDQAAFDRVAAEWRGLGAPAMFICRTTIQQLYVSDMGVEAAIYALMDYPATCERYFEALNQSQERLIHVINASPVRLINFGDNLHGSTTTPALFEKYILPVYQRRCELLHAAGKFVTSHWDGNCKPLLPYARDTGLDGIEAITPQPQGDVTLEETKAALGDMWLLDGIPAVFFDHTYSEQTLLDCARKCIDLFAPHLILGASDEVSSHGDIERVRLVGEVVDAYNATVNG